MPSDFPGEDEDLFDPRAIEAKEKQMAEAITASEDVVIRHLRRRQQAYKSVFTAGERTQDDIDLVLIDLMYFCRAIDPTFDPRDGVHADILGRIKEGRREVFLRIREHSCLDFDALLVKYTNAVTK